MLFVQKKMLRFCDINIFDFLMRNRFQNLGPHYHYWGFIEAKTDYERPYLGASNLGAKIRIKCKTDPNRFFLVFKVL